MEQLEPVLETVTQVCQVLASATVWGNKSRNVTDLGLNSESDSPSLPSPAAYSDGDLKARLSPVKAAEVHLNKAKQRNFTLLIDWHLKMPEFLDNQYSLAALIGSVHSK